ncbi:MAG: addiction module toxin RelE [Clostridiaceae bacterium]|nr:addiction module toxin RelE [Clostridiaceae bacterium]
MQREFVRLPEFEKCWQSMGLSEDDIRKLEETLCEDPQKSDLIRGTGGLRKLRWPLPDKSKSRSIRVVYVDFVVYERIYFITAYPKSKKDNLTDVERKEIRKLIELLSKELKRK